jgi:hypothetical protein
VEGGETMVGFEIDKDDELIDASMRRYVTTILSWIDGAWRLKVSQGNRIHETPRQARWVDLTRAYRT